MSDSTQTMSLFNCLKAVQRPTLVITYHENEDYTSRYFAVPKHYSPPNSIEDYLFCSALTGTVYSWSSFLQQIGDLSKVRRITSLQEWKVLAKNEVTTTTTGRYVSSDISAGLLLQNNIPDTGKQVLLFNSWALSSTIGFSFHATQFEMIYETKIENATSVAKSPWSYA